MGRISTLALLCLLCARPLSARDRHEWNNVEKLKAGSKVLVALWNQNPIEGRFQSATGTVLRIVVASPGRGHAVREFPRESVWSIQQLRGPRLGDPDSWMRKGALIGGSGGVTIGIIRDARGEPGAGLNWFVDGLAGAVLGFFASCAVAAATGIVALFRHDRVIYLDARPPASFPELNVPVPPTGGP
jgi:hypothetical protein